MSFGEQEAYVQNVEYKTATRPPYNRHSRINLHLFFNDIFREVTHRDQVQKCTCEIVCRARKRSKEIVCTLSLDELFIRGDSKQFKKQPKIREKKITLAKTLPKSSSWRPFLCFFGMTHPQSAPLFLVSLPACFLFPLVLCFFLVSYVSDVSGGGGARVYISAWQDYLGV